jgi:hypothetical protein
MAILIEKEIFAQPITDLELCCFCSIPTPFWSVKKDVPVCPDCAQVKQEAQVPNKRMWVRAPHKIREMAN